MNELQALNPETATVEDFKKAMSILASEEGIELPFEHLDFTFKEEAHPTSFRDLLIHVPNEYNEVIPTLQAPFEKFLKHEMVIQDRSTYPHKLALDEYAEPNHLLPQLDGYWTYEIGNHELAHKLNRIAAGHDLFNKLQPDNPESLTYKFTHLNEVTTDLAFKDPAPKPLPTLDLDYLLRYGSLVSGLHTAVTPADHLAKAIKLLADANQLPFSRDDIKYTADGAALEFGKKPQPPTLFRIAFSDPDKFKLVTEWFSANEIDYKLNEDQSATVDGPQLAKKLNDLASHYDAMRPEGTSSLLDQLTKIRLGEGRSATSA